MSSREQCRRSGHNSTLGESGATLCYGWETGLTPPLVASRVQIDPRLPEWQRQMAETDALLGFSGGDG